MTAILYSLETADGYLETFDLNASQAFLNIVGLGASPIDFQVKKGYKQHGQTELTYSLQPRRVGIELWAEHEAENRQAYFDLRARLLDLLRPNRGGPMILTVLLPDMTKRALTVRANPGLIYPANNENFWGIKEQFELIAFDPIFYNPESLSFTGINGVDSELVFPIDFPIWFGDDDSSVLSTGDFTYLGNWDSYPIVTLTGPYTSARLINSVLSAYVALIVPIDVGETRIIDLTPGVQSIVDGAGVSRFGELSAGSNLIDFAVKPAPVAPNGVQSLSVLMTGFTAGVSAASLIYYDRFYAI